MNLASFIAKEQNITHDQIMLLRHSNRMISKLLQYGASIEEDYTFVQPVNSAYDFYADGQTPIKLLVVIVNDSVYGVYSINSVLQHGTSRTLTSPNFRAFDESQGHHEKNAKKFARTFLPSKAQGRTISGWTSPIRAVARYGHKIFESVELV